MKLNFHSGVTVAATLGLASPDLVINFFKTTIPVLDWLVRFGQVGVAIATVIYIYKKWNARPKPRKKK